GRGAGGLLRLAGRDGRLAPRRAGRLDEGLALAGRGERLRVGAGEVGVLQVERQAEQGQVPADTGRAGAVLLPELVGDVGGVDEGEPGTLGVVVDLHLDPAGLAAELPGGGEPGGAARR